MLMSVNNMSTSCHHVIDHPFCERFICSKRYASSACLARAHRSKIIRCNKFKFAYTHYWAAAANLYYIYLATSCAGLLLVA